MNADSTLKRRHLIAALPWVAAPALLQAQRQWTEGKHYTRLQPAVPQPAGKVEVVEFFWYGCPTCYAFEPALKAWEKSLPPWVSFRTQAVFLREQTRAHQRLAFVLQAMGVEAQFRPAIFKALHEQRLMLQKPAEMVELLKPLGLDVPRFEKTWAAFDPKAFSGARIESANRQAAQVYKVNGVPMLAVGGRYLVSPVNAAASRNESPFGATALAVADHLLSTLKPV